MFSERILTKPNAPLRVLIVDDSAVVRQTLSAIIESDAELQVMAAAADPFVAAEKMRQEKPDVIILDVEMPRMDGITFLRKLMEQHPIPVVICSTLVAEKSETYFEAMAAGAVDIVHKPEMGVKAFIEESRQRICDTIKLAGRAKMGRQRPGLIQAKLTADEILAPASGTRAMTRTTEKVIAIGASTGGTEALRVVLQSMPADCPPIIIVQHMPAAFTAAFAKRLNSLCAITVAEAKPGDRLLRGHALIAPGGRHMLLQRSGAAYTVALNDGPPVSRHRPSVDVLFRSVARFAGRNAVGAIMTGMGDDGAHGMKEMLEAGARTLGQNEASCIVYGMPREAKLLGAVEEEVDLSLLASAILRKANDANNDKG